MGTALLATFSETRKGLLLMWDYRFNLFMQLFMLSFIFVGISFFMGQGELQPEALASTLLGYLVWFYAVGAISNMSWNLMEEMQAGTLEQMYMSPAPSSMILIGRVLSTMISTTVMVSIVAVALMLLLGVQLPMRLEGLPVLGITLIGLFGFGFIIGGATLLFKQVEALANLAQYVLLFLNGSLLPVDQLPPTIEAFALSLPSTQGIIVLRNVVLEGQSLVAAWNDQSLIWLTVHSVVYFVVGLIIFKWCEKRARTLGSLGHY